MTDIFQEVEEDVRRERFDTLWKQYGEYVFAALAVLVLAVAGWQYWKSYHGKELVRASDAYSSAVLKAGSGDSAGAAMAFAKLAKDAPGGYATLARLQQANALLAGSNVADAVAIYKVIEQSSDPTMAAVARLRHAWAVADFASRSDVAQILAPLNNPGSAWKYSVREVLAYSDYHNGDTAQATAEFSALASDTSAPAPLRQRARIMSSFLGSGAGRDVGTVPPPPPAPATGASPDPSNSGTP